MTVKALGGPGVIGIDSACSSSRHVIADIPALAGQGLFEVGPVIGSRRRVKDRVYIGRIAAGNAFKLGAVRTVAVKALDILCAAAAPRCG